MPRQKALFFSLHSEIWLHALPEQRLAVTLLRDGHEVVQVHCGRMLKGHCVCMSAESVELTSDPTIKEYVCTACVRNADELATIPRMRRVWLSNSVEDADATTVESALEALSDDTYLQFAFDGVPVGRLASYEVLLKYKKMSPKLSMAELLFLRTYVANAIRAMLAFKRLLETEKPNLVFMYSPQYAVNGACAELAIRSGCKVYFVEGSSNNAERYSALRIWDWSVHGLVNPALAYWPDLQSLVTDQDEARVDNHIAELLRGESFAVYSKGASTMRAGLDKLALPTDTKIILAAASSFDEAYAAFMIGKFPETKVKSQVFANQFEWIESTIKELAHRKDITLVVRLHPRDFPNKREGQLSEQSHVWQRLLKDLPDNVRVNWPSDDISLYDLLGVVDVLLTGWSATGMEALISGIPVVTYDRNLPSYPPDIHLTGSSRAAYFENIERALAAGRDAENARRARKWLAFSFSLGVVNVPPIAQPDANSSRAFRLASNILGGERVKSWVRAWDVKRGLSDARDAAVLATLVRCSGPDLYAARKALCLGQG